MSEVKEKALQKILARVEKPARYIGCEKGSIVKDNESNLSFAFCFPDLYEIGMSYTGLQILYNIINRRDGLACERCFAPAEDMREELKKNDMRLFTLETRTPLSEMDAVGFTLQYEMSFATILDMLELGGITLKAEERGEDEPLIVAGGPCAFNPEPLADYIDIFMIGDGEALLPEALLKYKELRAEGKSKEEILLALSDMQGVYVPRFYEPIYGSDGVITEYRRLDDRAPERVLRAFVGDLEDAVYPVEPLIPFIETVHDRAVVETFRGCTRGCRFCQAGMIYRPIRERSKETITRLAIDNIKNTGHDELSLLSLSTSDHSEFEELALALVHECADRNVALSLPSLRLDSFSFTVLQEIQKYRKSGLTFAPEAGTQRLRNVINKGITEKDIFDAVSQAIDLGWTHVKLYFMIGLPTETDEDLDGIADIAKSIMNIAREKGVKGRFNVTVSVSNFVPKAHTPFQWVAQNSVSEFRRKHDYLFAKLRIKGVTFNYHDDHTSVLEAVLARGDRRIGAMLREAHNLGCRLDGWQEYFDENKWIEAAEKAGIDMSFYAARERARDEVLPWDIIDSGIRKEFLLGEEAKALAAETTHDCRYGCTGCGVNRHTECRWGGIYG